MRYRYYITQMDGKSYPDDPGNWLIDMGGHWYERGKKYVEDAETYAWGYVEYMEPLTEEEVRKYGLAKSVSFVGYRNKETGEMLDWFEMMDQYDDRYYDWKFPTGTFDWQKYYDEVKQY